METVTTSRTFERKSHSLDSEYPSSASDDGSTSSEDTKDCFSLENMKKAFKSMKKTLLTPKGDYGSTNTDTQLLMDAVDCDDETVMLKPDKRQKNILMKFSLSKSFGSEAADDGLPSYNQGEINPFHLSSKNTPKHKMYEYELLAANEEERRILNDKLLQYGLEDCGL